MYNNAQVPSQQIQIVLAVNQFRINNSMQQKVIFPQNICLYRFASDEGEGPFLSAKGILSNLLFAVIQRYPPPTSQFDVKSSIRKKDKRSNVTLLNT